MQKFGFVCEKKIFDTCVFDLVEYGDQCIDFRLDARYDQHSWDGAMQMCKDFGMDMLQMSNKGKDEWVNEYLWNSGLFGSDVTYKGVWIGAHGEIFIHRAINIRIFIYRNKMTVHLYIFYRN